MSVRGRFLAFVFCLPRFLAVGLGGVEAEAEEAILARGPGWVGVPVAGLTRALVAVRPATAPGVHRVGQSGRSAAAPVAPGRVVHRL